MQAARLQSRRPPSVENLDVRPVSRDNDLVDVGRTYGRTRVRMGGPDEKDAVVFTGETPRPGNLGKEIAPEWRNWQTRGIQNPVLATG